MKIRSFTTNDTPVLINLFRKTVHTVCKKDYSQEQLDAWAPNEIDESTWNARLNRSFAIVAEDNGSIVGFATLLPDGCIDMFYVACDSQSRGVGQRLFEALEAEAKLQNIIRLHSDVSLTARPFFFSKGFVIEKEYSKKIGNVTFLNAIMAKMRN